MLSLVYIFSAHNNYLALSALKDDLEVLHCSSNGSHGAIFARFQLAPTARRQHPMPLLGSNRGAEVANGSMDPDRACLNRLGSSEAGHEVLDARSPRAKITIFTYFARFQLAPTARRQHPMPLLGSNRASEVANGSMDPDRACLTVVLSYLLAYFFLEDHIVMFEDEVLYCIYLV